MLHFHALFCLFSLLFFIHQPPKMGLQKIQETKHQISLALGQRCVMIQCVRLVAPHAPCSGASSLLAECCSPTYMICKIIIAEWIFFFFFKILLNDDGVENHYPLTIYRSSITFFVNKFSKISKIRPYSHLKHF